MTFLIEDTQIVASCEPFVSSQSARHQYESLSNEPRHLRVCAVFRATAGQCSVSPLFVVFSSSPSRWIRLFAFRRLIRHQRFLLRIVAECRLDRC